MAVMAPREKWTDDRLDDLNKRVDDGFARVEGDIRELRFEVKTQGESLRAEMGGRFEKAGTSLDKTEKTLEGKIDGTKVDLEKKIDGTKVDLEKKIDGVKADLDGVKGDLEKKIDGLKVDLEKKIDDLGKSVGELRGEINRALVGGVAALILTQIAGGILF
jgi:chromosome segregation ATPase